MLSKKQTSTPGSKKVLFSNTKNKDLPTINIQAANPIFDTKYLLSSKRGKEIVENLGFLSISLSPCSRSKYRSSKISMTDLMGKTNCEKILTNQKLRSIKKKLENEIMIEENKMKRSLFKPGTPNNMDRNMMLRIKLEEMKKGKRKVTAPHDGLPSSCYKRKRMFIYFYD